MAWIEKQNFLFDSERGISDLYLDCSWFRRNIFTITIGVVDFWRNHQKIWFLKKSSKIVFLKVYKTHEDFAIQAHNALCWCHVLKAFCESSDEIKTKHSADWILAIALDIT